MLAALFKERDQPQISTHSAAHSGQADPWMLLIDDKYIS